MDINIEDLTVRKSKEIRLQEKIEKESLRVFFLTIVEGEDIKRKKLSIVKKSKKGNLIGGEDYRWWNCKKNWKKPHFS